MTDVFISYARADHEIAEKVFRILNAEGLSVWMDREIHGGAEYAKDIEASLSRAKAVVVIWSERSVESNWVKDEAASGRDAGKLIPVRIDDVTAPLGFRQFQTIDISASAKDPGMRALIDSVRLKVGQDVSSSAPQENHRRPNQRVFFLIGGALVAVAALVFGIGIIGRQSTEQMASEDTQQTNRSDSIAVLPFEAFSNDDSDVYFGRGIAEELIGALAGIPDLKVASSVSSLVVNKTADGSISAIGETLGVENVLRGSVRRAGNRIRISAQLIRTVDGFSVWSKTYEESASDVFEIEDAIVTDIARVLQVRLGVGSGAMRAPRGAVAPDAYEYYLRGLYEWGRRMTTDDARRNAIADFERAVEIDPNFGPAWTALADSLLSSVGSPIARRREEYRQQTENALSKSIETAPDSAQAHANFVFWYSTQAIDIEKAETHLEILRRLRVSDDTGAGEEAIFLHMVGREEEAAAAWQRALRNDPLNYSSQRARAAFFDEIGQPKESFAFYDTCHEQKCLAEGFYAFVMAAAIFNGDPDRIAEWLPRFETLSRFVETLPDSAVPPVARLVPAFVSIELDLPDKNDHLARIKAIFADTVISDTPGIWAPTFASILPVETIIDALHLAYERGDLFASPFALAPFTGINPYPKEVLSHPKYHALWQKPGMPELAARRRLNGQTAGLPVVRDRGI